MTSREDHSGEAADTAAEAVTAETDAVAADIDPDTNLKK